MICGYCGDRKAKGWHDCAQAQSARKRIGQIKVNIDEMMRGGMERTENRLINRGLDNMRANVRASGKEVKEYGSY